MFHDINLGQDEAADGSLRAKLSLIAVVVMATVMIPFGWITIRDLRHAAVAEAIHDLKATNRILVDMAAAQQDGLSHSLLRMSQAFIKLYPGAFSLDEKHPMSLAGRQVPTLQLNGKPMDLDGTVVDTLADHVGGRAAILVRVGEDFVSVLTSFRKEDGSRAVGTLMDKKHPAYDTVTHGRSFKGVVRLVGRPYLANYVPVRDASGRIVAIFVVGMDLGESIRSLLDKMGTLSIGRDGYVFIIDANPGEGYGEFILHPAKAGKSALNGEQEAPIQEMLKRREGVLFYDWRNSERGEGAPRQKIAAYSQYRDLGWIIGTSGYPDDLLTIAMDGRDRMILAILVASIIAVFALNLAVGRWVMKPMFRMQERIRSAGGMLQTLVQSIPDLVWFKDTSGTFVACNRQFERLLGVSADQIVGKTDYDFVPRQLADFFRARDQVAIDSRSATVNEEWVTLADGGDRRMLETVKTPVEDSHGQIIGVLGIGRDITERRQAEARTRQAATVFENARESILIADLDGRILAVNKAFREITGYEEAEVLGQNPRLLQSSRQGPEFYQELWNSVLKTGHWQGEIWNRRKNGELYPSWMTISTVRDDHGNPTHYVAVATDISQLKRHEEQLAHLAHHDPLTELPNRLLLESRLVHALERVQRQGHRVAILFIDLDHFKTINDSFGHIVGDQLLVDVARRLGQRVRDGDTLSRFGGDEFVVVLEPIDEPEAAAIVARDLLACLTSPFHLPGGDEAYIGASIGISIFPEDCGSAAELVRNAHTAMYQAKDQGRNRFCFYTGDMNAKAVAQLELEVALRRAVEHNEFILHYQPKADLQTGQVYGAEALIRWQREGRNLVLPGNFIPLAEKTGLIIPIGNWVIDAACRQLRAWRDAGLRELQIAVNISGRQFHVDDLPDVVAQALVRHGVAPSSLELELTESFLMEDPERTITILMALKRIGVKLSLDDFGTGYSSFAYLSRFPIDVLKIDQSFVRNIVTDARSAMIAVSIIDLAHRLHLKVVAEGVETEPQLGYLRMRDCDEMQGYYFAKPMPVEEFEALVREGRKLALNPDATNCEERTLLLVDDEPNVLAALRRLLRQEGYRVLTAESGNRGLELLATHPIQVIVTDQRMPEMTGTEFLSRVKEMHPDTMRMVLSGYTDLDSVTDSVNSGAIYKFLHKPWDDAQLRDHVRDAFRYYERVIRPRKG